MGGRLSRSVEEGKTKDAPPGKRRPRKEEGEEEREGEKKRKKRRRKRKSPDFPLAAFLLRRGRRREDEKKEEEGMMEMESSNPGKRKEEEEEEGDKGVPPRAPPASSSASSSSVPPYARRVLWLKEIQEALKGKQRQEALRALALLRKDLGLEGTFLSEVLYRNAAFLNLVDPISHDLLMNLARDLQCPKKEYDPWKSSDRICRQLIYHLTPHSKWRRNGRRKSHGSLKNNLQKKLTQDAVDLSGIPLSARDVHRLAYYLQNNGGHLTTIDLSFTDLADDTLRILLPFLWSLPGLTHLSLNGNRLTRAAAKELTDAVKDPAKFPFLAWIDLGNNVDISSMPQPLLVGLRKRLGRQTTLPTIYENTEEEDGETAAAARRSCER